MVESAAANVDSRRANSKRPLFEVDVRPALPSDLAAP
jgi:hypothetical protein